MIVDDDGLDLDDLPELALPYERNTFLWLNNHHSDFWDVFMMIYSGKLLWVPLCAVLLFVIFYKSKWQNAVLFLLCFILLATLCDQISASLVKPFFSRLRPTHHPDFMYHVLIVDDYRGGRYGFISSHACNGFGVTTFIALVFKQRRLTVALIAWALLSCYSRIYLGVHFITDILGGIFLGTLIGFLIYLLFQYCRVKILKTPLPDMKKPLYTRRHANILIATLGLTVLFNIIFSLFSIYLYK
ncbi:MAG: phosphatase PAP2 family protein [Dysgonomonas sp.]